MNIITRLKKAEAVAEALAAELAELIIIANKVKKASKNVDIGGHYDSRVVVAAVESHYKVSLQTKGRRHPIPAARMAGAYLLKKMSRLSYKKIASKVGLTNHSDAYYYDKKCKTLVELYEDTAAELLTIEEKIKHENNNI